MFLSFWPCITSTSFSIISHSLTLSLLPCDYTGHRQITQDNLPISKSLTYIYLQLLFPGNITYSKIYGIRTSKSLGVPYSAYHSSLSAPQRFMSVQYTKHIHLIPTFSKFQPITASTQSPKSLLNSVCSGMSEALDIIYPETRFLYICKLQELKKQVICSQNIVG